MASVLLYWLSNYRAVVLSTSRVADSSWQWASPPAQRHRLPTWCVMLTPQLKKTSKAPQNWTWLWKTDKAMLSPYSDGRAVSPSASLLLFLMSFYSPWLQEAPGYGTSLNCSLSSPKQVNPVGKRQWFILIQSVRVPSGFVRLFILHHPTQLCDHWYSQASLY